MHDRRQYLDQCRRREHAPLRQYATAGDGARSRAAGRANLDGLRALKKDNTGYHLKELFIGAEGTLGIVTKAVLKLFPKPKDVATAWIAVRDPAAAIQILSEARGASSDSVTSCELPNAFSVECILKYGQNLQRPIEGQHDWHVLMEWSSPRAAGEDASGTMTDRMETYLADCLERGLAIDATLAQSQAQARNMWAIRESSGSSMQRQPNPTCSFDVSVAVNKIPTSSTRQRGRAEERCPACGPAPAVMSATATSTIPSRHRSTSPPRPITRRW